MSSSLGGSSTNSTSEISGLNNLAGYMESLGGNIYNRAADASDQGSTFFNLSQSQEPLLSQYTNEGTNWNNQATGLINQAGTEYAQAQPTYNTGAGLYGASVSDLISGGQLTPEQQALVAQNLTQSNLGTAGTYANLGLGGSTMQQQDTNANLLASLAETANIQDLNKQRDIQVGTLGLSGEQAAIQQESIANQTLGQGISAGQLGATYGNLGLSAGQLANQTAQLGMTTEELGNQLFSTALGYGQAAGTDYSQAGTLANEANAVLASELSNKSGSSGGSGLSKALNTLTFGIL